MPLKAWPKSSTAGLGDSLEHLGEKNVRLF